MIISQTMLLCCALLLLLLLSETALVSGGEYNASSGVDSCDSIGVVCYNHGRCTESDPPCTCTVGYTGPYCDEAVSCGRLEMNHTEVQPRFDWYSYGQVVFYHCDHGYQFSDMPSDSAVIYKATVCGADGQWDPVVDCVALCPSIASWRGYIMDSSSRKLGTVVRYTCWGKFPWYRTDHAGEYQYKFKDGSAGDDTEHETECTEDGMWQPPIKECVEIDPDNETSSCDRNKSLLWLVTVCGLFLLSF